MPLCEVQPRTGGRRRLVGVAAALLLTAALTGCADGSDEPGAAASSSASEPVSKSPSPSPTEPSTRKPKPAPSPTPAAAATLDVRVSGDDVTPVAEQIDLEAGDTLRVRVRSDRVGELHVHSDPEQYVEFESGSVERELTLVTPGSVDIEEHESGALVARVLVR